MFYRCTNLNLLNISNFDTSYVTNMQNMFYGCSSLHSLDLSNFNTSSIRYNYISISGIFNSCSKLNYIKFKNVTLNSNFYAYNSNIFSSASKNLFICIENDNDTFTRLFREKLNVNCYYTDYDFDYENKIICYTKNSSLYNDYSCEICEYFILIEYNISKNDNNSSINCYGIKNQEYPSDSIVINTSIDIGISTDFNTDIGTHIDTDVNNSENETEVIQKLIKKLFEGFNYDEMNNGTDKKLVNKNMDIILTSTKNQIINEEKNNVSMNLCECENILKNEYILPFA